MPSQRSRPILHLLFPLLGFSHLGLASLSLQELQAIADFPPSCQAAYQSPIQSCPDASTFTKPDSGASVCSRECFIALGKAVISIQKACQNTAAPPGTVIAHAFTGDLAVFLCTPSTGGNPATSSDPSSRASPSTSATSASSTAASSSIESTSKKTSKSDSVSSSDTTTTTVASNTVVTSTVPPTSITTTISKVSSSNSPVSSSSSRPSQSSQPGGGGTPFDQVVPARAPLAQVSQPMLSLVFGLILAAILDVWWR